MEKNKVDEKTNIWLDCDPGLDDCFAIILAAGHQRLKLLGVSTSAGNSSIENTTINAANVLFQIGRSDITVYMGARTPISQGTELATSVHGEKGLGGVELIPWNVNPITENTFDEMRKRIMGADGPVVWISTGALTNLAILIQICPEILKKISLVSLMGGAIGKGNKTPAAQFNIYFDPYAAKMVFESGLNVVMVPLQVTHTNLASEYVLNKMASKKSQVSKVLLQLLHKYQLVYFQQGFSHPPLHDPCAVFFVLQPQQFTVKKAQVVVDTYPISLGRTNCDFRVSNTNVTVCLQMNVPRFWQVMLKLYQRMIPDQ